MFWAACFLCITLCTFVRTHGQRIVKRRIHTYVKTSFTTCNCFSDMQYKGNIPFKRNQRLSITLKEVCLTWILPNFQYHFIFLYVLEIVIKWYYKTDFSWLFFWFSTTAALHLYPSISCLWEKPLMIAMEEVFFPIKYCVRKTHG